MAEDVRARRERIRANMHQFYKLTPSKEAAATSPSLIDTPTTHMDPNAELVDSQHNIDSPNFDSTTYAADILKHATIKGLYEKDTALRREVRSLDGDLQDLVYRNYSKFINATDTIKQMRDNVVDIDQKLQSLSSNVRNITTVSNTISNNLETHRSKIEEMLERNRMLQKIKFLVELPVILRKYIADGRYAAAVDEWVNGDAFLTKCGRITAFHKTHDECRIIACDLWKKFEESVLLVDAKGVDISAPVTRGFESEAVTAKYGSTFQGSPLSLSDTSAAASPTAATTSSHTVAVIDKVRKNASNIVQAVVKLQLLSRTSIFTPEERPQYYGRDMYTKILERRESCLKDRLKGITAQFHSDLKSVISNLPTATSLNVSEGIPDGERTTAASPIIFDHIVRSLEAFNADSLYQSLRSLFADFVLQSTIILESVEPCFEPYPMEDEVPSVHHTLGNILSFIQPLLLSLASEVLPSYARAATTFLHVIIVQQAQVMDSHRSASEAAVLVQRVCEEGHRTINGHLCSLVGAFKRLAAAHLSAMGQVEVGIFSSKVGMVALGSLKVISSALYRYMHFNPLSQYGVSVDEEEAADRVSGPRGVKQKLVYDVRFIQCHNVLVASMLARLFASTTGENDGGALYPCVPTPSRQKCVDQADPFERLIALKGHVSAQDHFTETCLALLQHFIVLVSQHFGLLLQNIYLPSIAATKENNKATANGPSGPHEVFYTMYAQWAALHAATRHWFPDGDTSASLHQVDRSENRHIRHSSSVGVLRTPLPTTAQFQSRVLGGPNSGTGTPDVRRIFYEKLQTMEGNLTLLPQLHQHDKNGSILWGTLQIQDAIILSTMISFLENLRSHPLGWFTTFLSETGPSSSTAFQQLQVDLSFTLQQVSTNAVFWLKDDAKFVSLINEIAAEAYRQSCSGVGSSQPLGISVVEKLARSDI